MAGTSGLDVDEFGVLAQVIQTRVDLLNARPLARRNRLDDHLVLALNRAVLGARQRRKLCRTLAGQSSVVARQLIVCTNGDCRIGPGTRLHGRPVRLDLGDVDLLCMVVGVGGRTAGVHVAAVRGKLLLGFIRAQRSVRNEW